MMERYYNPVEKIETLADFIFGTKEHPHICCLHMLHDAEYHGEVIYTLHIDVLPRLKMRDIARFAAQIGLNPQNIKISWDGSMTLSWSAGRCSPTKSASSGIIVVERACLDWYFDEDEKKIYKFFVGRIYDFVPGDKVALDVWGRPGTGLVAGTILSVQSDNIIVRTEDSLDISEEYSIALS